MEVEAPELVNIGSSELAMYCRENRITRELFWAGFGFQVWCQLLTHLSRARDSSLLIVDEPEVYLHPDVQRQLLSLFRSFELDVLVASHSSEIIAEADPSEILLVEKRRRSAKRLRDVSGVQKVLTAIGSLQNLTLTRLASNRTVLFTEGTEDFDILRHFARKLGLSALGAGTDFTPVASGGFSSIDRVKALGWALDKALGQRLKIAAVYDRDYYCADHSASIVAKLREHIDVAHIHARKEMENYLLIPSVLQRALDRVLLEKARRAGQVDVVAVLVPQLLMELSEPFKLHAQSQYIAKSVEFNKDRKSRSDTSSITRDTLAWFEEQWGDLSKRMCIVPGKELLSAFRERLQTKHGVSLTSHKIINAFQAAEIPPDIVTLLEALQDLRLRKGHERPIKGPGFPNISGKSRI